MTAHRGGDPGHQGSSTSRLDLPSQERADQFMAAQINLQGHPQITMPKPAYSQNTAAKTNPAPSPYGRVTGRNAAALWSSVHPGRWFQT